MYYFLVQRNHFFFTFRVNSPCRQNYHLIIKIRKDRVRPNIGNLKIHYHIIIIGEEIKIFIKKKV